LTQQQTHSRFIPEGMTRDCIDPWIYVEIKINGGVSLCCVRKPVGNLVNQPLAHILHGNEARTLRRNLLSGEPDDICRACGLRGVTSPSKLQQKVGELRKSVTVPAEFDPAAYADTNPDVKEAKVYPIQHFRDWGRIEGRPLKPRAS
jgi:hypothetical protein